MTAQRYTPFLLFLLLALGVYVVATFIVATEALAEHAALGAAAVTFDLVILVPFLYYQLVVRRHRVPALTVLPIFLLSLGGAALLLPEGQQQFLAWGMYLAGPLELLLLAFIVRKVFQVRRRFGQHSGRDVYDQLRETLEEMIPVRAAAHAAAFEVALLYYALLSWRAVPACAEADETFSYHRKSGYSALLLGVLIGGVVEMVGVHFLLRMWSETAAWILTGLSLYSLVWLLGYYRAMILRPVLVTPDALSIREGLMKNVRVPFEDIAWMRPMEGPVPDRKAKGYLQAAALGRPQFLLKLKTPRVAWGAYGIMKQVDLVGIVVDEPDRFEEALVHRFEAWQTRHAR